MSEFKDIYNFKTWWSLIAATGALVTCASFLRGFKPGIAIGLGLLLFGAGEWASRPSKTEKETVEGMQGFRMVTTNRWQLNPIGLVLELIGAGLFGLGIFWLISR